MNATQAGVSGKLARTVRGAAPASFSMVMATGIVSAGLRQVGLPLPSAVLLSVAAVGFVVLTGASCWRACLFPAALRADLTCPARAFSSFAFVAACDVLGDGLANAGVVGPAAALAAVALAAWLVLTCVITLRVTALPRRPALTDVNGSWYLWTVGIQSVAIAAVFLRTTGVLPGGVAAAAAIATWSAGIVLYAGTTVLVAARLLVSGLGPVGTRAPYWVAMGAASISVLAAAQITRIPALRATAVHALVTGTAVGLWVLATVLIPVLATVTTAWYVRSSRRLHYQSNAWVIVFPLGMYAMASLQLGTAAGRAVIHDFGTVAIWPAAAAWALTFAAMIASGLAGLGRPPQWARPGHAPGNVRLPSRKKE